MRRKPGALVPFEISILQAATELRRRGTGEFHGFVLAKEIKDVRGAHFLTGYGTLYRALKRLEDRGFLSSQWEDPLIAAEEGRPRRKLYELTGLPIPAGS